MRFARFLIAAAALAATASTAAANAPRIPAESPDRVYPYDAQMPTCDDPGVIGRIQSRFARREVEYWNSTMTVSGVDRIRQTHFRPNGADLIPRRYCNARAIMSDGRLRKLDYFIVEDQGFSGWHGSLFLGLVRFPTPRSYNVEWCIVGLDPHRTYAQDCRMARP